MVTDKLIRMRMDPASPTLSLQDHPMVKASAGKARSKTSTVICFDTPSLQLRHKGVMLALHQEAKGWGQRFGPGAGEISDGGDNRGKLLCCKVPEPNLNLKKLKSTGAGRRLLGRIQLSALQAVSTVRCQATQWRLNFPDGARLLLTEERGEVVQGEETIPFHEVVLALQEGPLSRLYQAALVLVYALSPGMESLSPLERSFLRLDRSLMTVQVEKNIRVAPEMSAEKVFSLLAENMLLRIRRNQAPLLYGSESTRFAAIDEIFNALLRLRTLLALYDYLLPVAIRAELDDELKWLLDEMTPDNDWESFIAITLEPFISQFPTYPLADLRGMAEVQRRDSYQRMETAFVSTRFLRLITGLSNWVSMQGWRELTDMQQKRQITRPAAEAAKGMLDRHYRQVRRLVGKSLAELDYDTRRRLYEEGSFLLDASAIFADLFPGKSLSVFLNTLDWTLTALRALESVAVAHRLFLGFNLAADGATIHLVNGFLGAREESYTWDAGEAWQAFSESPEYWH